MSTIREITVVLDGTAETGTPGETCAFLLARLHNHLDRVALDNLVERALQRWRETLPYDLPRTTLLHDDAASTVLQALAQDVLHEVARSLDRGLAVDLALALSTILTPVKKKEEAS